VIDIKEKFYNIMETELEDGLDELIQELEDILNSERENENIKNYKYTIDTDVFDSPGLDIYSVSICWIDSKDNLEIASSSYYRD